MKREEIKSAVYKKKYSSDSDNLEIEKNNTVDDILETFHHHRRHDSNPASFFLLFRFLMGNRKVKWNRKKERQN